MQSIKELTKRLHKQFNASNHQYECYICKQPVKRFLPYKEGLAGNSVFWNSIKIVGSDVENFSCPLCWSHDRERHLVMYFDRIDMWNNIKGKRIMHFAPETHIAKRIKENAPEIHIQGDLFPTSDAIQKIDATQIPYEDNYFDLLIANHLLEHIPDVNKALSEFFRTLKPGGIAILQTPFSRALHNNIEDPGISSAQTKTYIYGQDDHCRLFSQSGLFNAITQAGFHLSPINHKDLFSAEDAIRYGVNGDEELIRAIKP